LVAAVPHGHWEIVILDNLGSHKVAGVRDAIQAHGATLVCLPPYSPDRNPIEQAFAKLKTLLRKLAARTVSSLWNALGDLLDRFTPQECANYLASAGYVPFNRNPLSRGFHDCLPGTPARTVGHLRFPRFEGSASPRRASQYEDRNRHQRGARDPS
jgi:transposase